MANLTFNGITLPSAAESLKEVPEFVGDVNERAASGAHTETHVVRKRKWTCRTVAQTAAEAIAMRRYLEGEGHNWSFDANMFSGKGEGPAVGGTYTRANSGGKFAGKVAVGSGSFLEYDLGSALGVPGGWTPTKGWTLMVFKVLSVGDGGDGSAYVHHIAKGAVAVTRGSSANPVGVKQFKNGSNGNHAMGNWIDIATDGTVSIHGKSNADASAAYDYSELVFLPFVIDDDWVSGLYAHLNAYPHAPLKQVTLSGDTIEDAAPGVRVHVKATEIQRRRRVFSGTATAVARELQLQITEA